MFNQTFPEGQSSSINLRSKRTIEFFCGWKTLRALSGAEKHKLYRYSQKSIKTDCTQIALWIIPGGRTTQKKARKLNTGFVLWILKLSNASLQCRYIITEINRNADYYSLASIKSVLQQLVFL